MVIKQFDGTPSYNLLVNIHLATSQQIFTAHRGYAAPRLRTIVQELLSDGSNIQNSSLFLKILKESSDYDIFCRQEVDFEVIHFTFKRRLRQVFETNGQK